MGRQRERIEALERAVRFQIGKMSGARVLVNGDSRARLERYVRDAIESGCSVADSCPECPLAQQFLDTKRLEPER